MEFFHGISMGNPRRHNGAHRPTVHAMAPKAWAKQRPPPTRVTHRLWGKMPGPEAGATKGFLVHNPRRPWRCQGGLLVASWTFTLW